MTFPSVTPIPSPGSRGLSSAELKAAALDGELHPFGSAFLPLDAPVDARARLAALSPPRGERRLIVSGRCAAWVWGWKSTPCSTLCCSVSSRHRVASTVRRAFSVREVVIDADELLVIDDVRITTPLRTIIDLARHDDDPGLDELLARALSSSGQGGEAGALSWGSLAEALDRRPAASHVRRARSRLQQALLHSRPQPLLTR